MYLFDGSSQMLEGLHSFIQSLLKGYYVPVISNSEMTCDPQGISWSSRGDQQDKKKPKAVKWILWWMVLKNANGSSLVTLTGLSTLCTTEDFNQHLPSPLHL